MRFLAIFLAIATSHGVTAFSRPTAGGAALVPRTSLFSQFTPHMAVALEPSLLQLLEEKRVIQFFKAASAEPPAVVELLKDAGPVAGIAYLIVAASFYAVAASIGELTVFAASGSWIDPRILLLPDGAEGKAEVLAALASFYLLCKPFAPVRLGGALFVTPDVKNFIEARPALVSFLESAAELWDASFGLVFATLSAPVRRELLKDEFLELARESRGGIDPLDAKKQARLDEIVTTLLPALNPTADPASSPLFSGEWECRWTTEAELNFAVDKGLFGLPWERTYQTIDVPSRVLTNVIEFEDGALTVESSVVPDEVDRARFNFAFSECSLRYKSITVPLPPVGRGWGELLYLDSDLRIQRDIRGDLLVAERVTEAS